MHPNKNSNKIIKQRAKEKEKGANLFVLKVS